MHAPAAQGLHLFLLLPSCLTPSCAPVGRAAAAADVRRLRASQYTACCCHHGGRAEHSARGPDPTRHRSRSFCCSRTASSAAGGSGGRGEGVQAHVPAQQPGSAHTMGCALALPRAVWWKVRHGGRMNGVCGTRQAGAYSCQRSGLTSPCVSAICCSQRDIAFHVLRLSHSLLSSGCTRQRHQRGWCSPVLSLATLSAGFDLGM